MRYQTRAVLAGAYRGRRALLDAGLTHVLDVEENRVLCGRVDPDNLADRFAMDPAANPTCPICKRRDPGLKSLCPHCHVDYPQHEYHCIMNGGDLDFTQHSDE